jgi:CBS domain-containing protein
MAAPLTLLAETARDMMMPGPVSIAADATAAGAAALLTARGVGSVVVIDAAGHPLGVVTKTDLLIHACSQARGMDEDATPVRDVMTPAVFSVRGDTSARSVVEQLLALNVHHLFVTDPAGVVIGVISPVDVLRKLG